MWAAKSAAAPCAVGHHVPFRAPPAQTGSLAAFAAAPRSGRAQHAPGAILSPLLPFGGELAPGADVSKASAPFPAWCSPWHNNCCSIPAPSDHLALQGHFKPEIRGDPQHKRWLIKERKPPGRRWPESPAVQEKQAACKGQERHTQLAVEARAGRLCHTECHRCVTSLITINHNNHRAEEGNAVTLTGMTLGGGRGEAKPAAESHSWSRVLGGLMAGGVMGASTWDKSTARLPGTETWYQQDLHCITGLEKVHQ